MIFCTFAQNLSLNVSTLIQEVKYCCCFVTGYHEVPVQVGQVPELRGEGHGRRGQRQLKGIGRQAVAGEGRQEEGGGSRNLPDEPEINKVIKHKLRETK
jgi:hypothetical protein